MFRDSIILLHIERNMASFTNQEEALAHILCQEGTRVVRAVGRGGYTIRVVFSGNLDELVAFINRLFRDARVRAGWSELKIHRF